MSNLIYRAIGVLYRNSNFYNGPLYGTATISDALTATASLSETLLGVATVSDAVAM